MNADENNLIRLNLSRVILARISNSFTWSNVSPRVEATGRHLSGNDSGTHTIINMTSRMAIAVATTTTISSLQ